MVDLPECPMVSMLDDCDLTDDNLSEDEEVFDEADESYASLLLDEDPDTDNKGCKASGRGLKKGQVGAKNNFQVG